MLRPGFNIEFKLNDKYVSLVSSNDVPLEMVKEALFQFQKYVGQVEDSVKAQQESKKKEEESKKVESLPVEEVKQA